MEIYKESGPSASCRPRIADASDHENRRFSAEFFSQLKIEVDIRERAVPESVSQIVQRPKHSFQ